MPPGVVAHRKAGTSTHGSSPALQRRAHASTCWWVLLLRWGGAEGGRFADFELLKVVVK